MKTGGNHDHLHTLVIVDANRLKSDQRMARNLLHCLAYAIAQAHRLYGVSMLGLVVNVTVLCVFPSKFVLEARKSLVFFTRSCISTKVGTFSPPTAIWIFITSLEGHTKLST